MRADSGLNRLVYEYFEAGYYMDIINMERAFRPLTKSVRCFIWRRQPVRAGLALLEKRRICKGRSENSARGGL